MQIEGAHEALEILKALPAEEFDFQPIRAWMDVWQRHGRDGGAVREDVERRGHGVWIVFYLENLVWTNRAMGILLAMTSRIDKVGTRKCNMRKKSCIGSIESSNRHRRKLWLARKKFQQS
jgi:hypothetical protein